MIPKEMFDTFSKSTQEELTEEPFSYRECTRCEDYFDLGGADNQRKEEAMYWSTEDFDCDDRKIIQYEKKHNFNIDDNVFCFSCMHRIAEDLENGTC